MQFFETQQDAEKLFNKIRPAAEKHRVIFLILSDKEQINPIKSDIEILLQRFNLKSEPNKIKVEQTTNNKSQTIIFSTEKEYEQGRLIGVPRSAIIRV